MDRRQFVTGASFVIASAATRAGFAASEPITETAYGKVRGVNDNGVYVFKGIPYGASTAGENRFMPPQKPQPWTGVKDCLNWGPMCSQVAGGTLGGGVMGREFGLLFGVGASSLNLTASEDCLLLNVFTRGLRDGKKRPVMVWIHGGGFQIGGSADPRTDGTNLARNHDVVSVSLNHRLGVLGYCHFGDLDKDFAHSGNVGQLDLVAALEWVRDNIEAFGGDPKNVLIHGESGGGSKVNLLMAMPAAKGLFQRAICQSGLIRKTPTGWGIPDRAKATAMAADLLGNADLLPNQIRDLQRRPVEKVLAACVTPTMPAPGIQFAPVLGTADMPEPPMEAVAKGSARMPFMIGCTMHEANFMLASEGVDKTKVNDEELKKRTARLISPEHTAELIEGYRKNYPTYTPGEILVRVMTDYTRFESIKMAEAHIQGGGAPTYMYYFTWQSPLMPDLQASHGIDGSFYFGNTEYPPMTKGNPEAQHISAQGSAAWASFARSGNPSNPKLGTWPEYTIEKRTTMVFAAKSHVENDPAGADRLLWEKVSAA